jgi:hypothetical protein
MIVDPENLWNKRTERIHPSYVQNKPYHQRIYDQMGAVNIARSQEVALLQMSMMPGGIDMFHRNMAGVQQLLQDMEPPHVVGDADLAGAAARVDDQVV